MSEKREFGARANGCRVSRIADRSDIAHYLVCGKRQSGGWLCDADDVAASGDFFEVLLALTELNCTDRLCITEMLPWRCGSEEFEERAESLFRAAVYGGELSVMLCGHRSACDVAEAFELMNKSFCRLEEQGREASGYLLRGVMINSPMALLEAKYLPRVDFVCFDFEALCERLLGYPSDIIAEDVVLCETLCRFWEECRRECFAHTKTELRAISGGLFSSKLFEDWAEFMEIREIYTPKQATEQKNT